MSLSKAFPATVILLWCNDEIREENRAASRDRDSASLKRTVREKPGGNDDVLSEATDVADATDATESRRSLEI